MFKAIVSKLISKFESNYNYDASYMHEINAVSASASLRLMMLSGMTNFEGSNKSIWGGAALAATLHGDCGPCAQLMVDRLIEQNFSEQELIACIDADWAVAADVGLGFSFAKAVLNNHHNLDSLRADILNKHGESALVAASFATASYPVYPLLKRALGSAEACQSLMIGEHNKPVVGANL